MYSISVICLLCCSTIDYAKIGMSSCQLGAAFQKMFALCMPFSTTEEKELAVVLVSQWNRTVTLIETGEGFTP